MIRAVLNNETGLLWALLAALIASAAVAAAVARRRSAPLLLSMLVGVSTALVLTATLYPINPGAPAPLLCTVQRDLISAMSSTQGLMNIALFVPAGFFTALLVRRPVSTGVALTLLSAAVEAVQAVTPGVGRSCDTADLWDNALGTAVGCGLAFLWSRRNGVEPLLTSRNEIARGSMARSGGVAVLAVAVVPFVTVISADVTESTLAGPAQRAAAAKAFGDFFGPAARTKSVQYVAGTFGQPGVINVTGEAGSLTLSWPGGEPTTGLVGPLPDQAPGELTDAAAVASATRFVEIHFPGHSPAATPAPTCSPTPVEPGRSSGVPASTASSCRCAWTCSSPEAGRSARSPHGMSNPLPFPRRPSPSRPRAVPRPPRTQGLSSPARNFSPRLIRAALGTHAG